MPCYDVYYQDREYAAVAGHPLLCTVHAPDAATAILACLHMDPHHAGLIAIPHGALAPGARADGTVHTTDPGFLPE